MAVTSSLNTIQNNNTRYLLAVLNRVDANQDKAVTQQEIQQFSTKLTDVMQQWTQYSDKLTQSQQQLDGFKKQMDAHPQASFYHQQYDTQIEAHQQKLNQAQQQVKQQQELIELQQRLSGFLNENFDPLAKADGLLSLTQQKPGTASDPVSNDSITATDLAITASRDGDASQVSDFDLKHRFLPFR